MSTPGCRPASFARGSNCSRIVNPGRGLRHRLESGTTRTKAIVGCQGEETEEELVGTRVDASFASAQPSHAEESEWDWAGQTKNSTVASSIMHRELHLADKGAPLRRCRPAPDN